MRARAHGARLIMRALRVRIVDDSAPMKHRLRAAAAASHGHAVDSCGCCMHIYRGAITKTNRKNHFIIRELDPAAE